MPKEVDEVMEDHLPNGHGYQVPDPDEGLRERPRYEDKDYDNSEVEQSPYPTLNNNTKEAMLSIEAVVRRFKQQKNQAGEAKTYFRKNYVQNKSEIKHQSKRRYTRVKNNPQFKRRNKKYKDTPEKFKRKPPGFRSQSERSEDYRKRQQRKLKNKPTSPVTKTAMIAQDILQGIRPSIEKDALSMRVGKPKTRGGVSHYTVDSTSGNSYRVSVSLTGVDIHMSCDCPFWQWQGPEHWASTEDYLYGSPRGTASKPIVKDPNSEHRLCKHAVAVLNRITR